MPNIAAIKEATFLSYLIARPYRLHLINRMRATAIRWTWKMNAPDAIYTHPKRVPPLLKE